MSYLRNPLTKFDDFGVILFRIQRQIHCSIETESILNF